MGGDRYFFVFGMVINKVLELMQDLFADRRAFVVVEIGQKVAKKFGNKVFALFLVTINVPFTPA